MTCSVNFPEHIPENHKNTSQKNEHIRQIEHYFFKVSALCMKTEIINHISSLYPIPDVTECSSQYHASSCFQQQISFFCSQTVIKHQHPCSNHRGNICKQSGAFFHKTQCGTLIMQFLQNDMPSKHLAWRLLLFPALRSFLHHTIRRKNA